MVCPKKVIAISVILITFTSGCLFQSGGGSEVGPNEDLNFTENSDFSQWSDSTEVSISEGNTASFSVGTDEENIYLQFKNPRPESYETVVNSLYYDEENVLNLVLVTNGEGEGDVVKNDRAIQISSDQVPDGVDSVKVILNDAWGEIHNDIELSM